MSVCNRYWCLPVSSPCQISAGIGRPCLQLPGPFSAISLPQSPCAKTFPLLLLFLWCYSMPRLVEQRTLWRRDWIGNEKGRGGAGDVGVDYPWQLITYQLLQRRLVVGKVLGKKTIPSHQNCNAVMVPWKFLVPLMNCYNLYFQNLVHIYTL